MDIQDIQMLHQKFMLRNNLTTKFQQSFSQIAKVKKLQIPDDLI